jgi:prephenate dehydrogenase
MGLALRNAKQDLTIVGTDRDWSLAQRMHKLGAVDRLERRPVDACKGSGLIILAEPLNDMETIFDAIASVALPGSVVTDIAPLKADVMKWATKLPDTVSFVGGHPLILAKVGDQPHADLFNGVQYCLVPAMNATPQAVEAVSGLVALLGAQPYLLDAAEHDGLVAAVEGLPYMLQVALMTMLSEAGSWRDNKRAAGRPFVNATAALESDAAQEIYRHRLNRQQLALWIDAYQSALSKIKTELEAEQKDAFQARLTGAHRTRAEWLRDRKLGLVDTGVPRIKVEKPSFLNQLLWPGRFISMEKHTPE